MRTKGRTPALVYSRPFAFIGGPILLILLGACTGCDREPQEKTGARPAVLVVSGDTAGWITPCGCTSNQSGGLLRRGTYLAGLSKGSQVVYADVGGAAAGTSDYQRVKLEAILSGEMKMGLVAHNLGKSEAALGRDYLRALAQTRKIPFVSCNVGDVGGALIAEPVRFAVAAGRRLAIVGVLSPRFAPAGLRVDDPRQSILAAVSSAKGKYDALIILAYMPQDELEQLAAALPEADAIVGGPTGQPVAPRRVGPTCITSATNKGKFLARLDIPPSGPWDAAVVEMDGSYADDPAQQQNLGAFHDELARRDFTAEQSGLVEPLPAGAPADYRIAGSDSCTTCHQAEHDAWAVSGHARAWQTLKAKGFDMDPYCMQCHTTGYGLPGGFVSRGRSLDRVSVGCENCHGPSQAHVRDSKVRTPFVAADQCTRCHDHENSPKFEFATFWPRVRHGKGASPEPTK